MTFIFIILFFVPMSASAGENEGIPVHFVFFQVLNFSLFVGALIYLLKKKVPALLEQKQNDFLEYRQKAIELEKKHTEKCAFLEKDLQALMEKEKNLNKSVAKAVNLLEEELKNEGELWLENLQRQVEQELKRQQFTEISRLKNKLLSHVIQKTAGQLKEIKPEEILKLNSQTLQKWEQI